MTKRELDNAGSVVTGARARDRGARPNVNIHTEDLGEALTAYMERRTPDFKGR